MVHVYKHNYVKYVAPTLYMYTCIHNIPIYMYMYIVYGVCACMCCTICLYAMYTYICMCTCIYMYIHCTSVHALYSGGHLSGWRWEKLSFSCRRILPVFLSLLLHLRQTTIPVLPLVLGNQKLLKSNLVLLAWLLIVAWVPPSHPRCMR